MIQLHAVRKSYDDRRSYAVDGVNLRIERRQLLVLLGESGCGKTTTLKVINRLIDPTDGRIEIDGEDNREIDPVRLRRRIGYVFQGIGLFPHMTIADNIAIVPQLLGWKNEEIDRRVEELLNLMGLGDTGIRHRQPAQLSGGQRQRVGLARALAARPKIMLMDEPFGALDPLTRDDLQREFEQIHADQELTTVMVTHDMTEALLMADQIAVMRQGRIISIGTPHDLLTKPQDEYTSKLMEMPTRQADRLDSLRERQ